MKSLRRSMRSLYFLNMPLSGVAQKPCMKSNWLRARRATRTCESWPTSALRWPPSNQRFAKDIEGADRSASVACQTNGSYWESIPIASSAALPRLCGIGLFMAAGLRRRSSPGQNSPPSALHCSYAYSPRSDYDPALECLRAYLSRQRKGLYVARFHPRWPIFPR
jgi:hypothetical protein